MMVMFSAHCPLLRSSRALYSFPRLFPSLEEEPWVNSCPYNYDLFITGYYGPFSPPRSQSCNSVQSASQPCPAFLVVKDVTPSS